MRLFSVIFRIIVGGLILPLCWEAIGVFYSPSQLGEVGLCYEELENVEYIVIAITHAHAHVHSDFDWY